ncbi:MAG: PepSY-associated TM helix domain-containing protein, partial [Telluria sp.]
MRSSGSTSSSQPTALPGATARRAVWLRQLHQWHWISSAICLMAMLLFSITGFTLNHATQIEAKPAVTR